MHLVSNASMTNFVLPLLHDGKNVFTMLQQMSRSQTSSSCSILHEAPEYSSEQIESIENESIALGWGHSAGRATPECQYLFKWIVNYSYKIEQLQEERCPASSVRAFSRDNEVSESRKSTRPVQQLKEFSSVRKHGKPNIEMSFNKVIHNNNN